MATQVFGLSPLSSLADLLEMKDEVTCLLIKQIKK